MEGHIWVARHAFDTNTDRAYVTFGYDRDKDGVGFQFKLATYDRISDGSGAWSTQNVGMLTTDSPLNYIAPRINSGGNVECFAYVDGDGTGSADAVVATLEGGNWTAQTLLTDICHKNAIVRNGNDDFLGYFSQWDGTDDYDNRLYAVGTEFSRSSGLLGETGVYCIDEGIDSTVYDDSTGNRDGTISGGTWATDVSTGSKNDTFAFFFVVELLVNPVAGRLADRYRPRPTAASRARGCRRWGHVLVGDGSKSVLVAGLVLFGVGIAGF